VVDKARPAGVTVYHDVTNRRWAEKALQGGVDGFICVNNRAGGHAGSLSPQQLLDELAPLQKPLVCAGGIGTPEEFAKAIGMGYSGVQSGTRFIATRECNAHPDYKSAILYASEQDIVLSEKISGVPVAIIRTPYIERIGTRAGPIAKWMLKGRKTKHWMRAIYSLQSIWKLKHASMQGADYKDYFQAGKSVSGIQEIRSAAAIVSDYAAALETDSQKS
jgi:nitronate monooxygenase